MIDKKKYWWKKLKSKVLNYFGIFPNCSIISKIILFFIRTTVFLIPISKWGIIYQYIIHVKYIYIYILLYILIFFN